MWEVESDSKRAELRLHSASLLHLYLHASLSAWEIGAAQCVRHMAVRHVPGYSLYQRLQDLQALGGSLPASSKVINTDQGLTWAVALQELHGRRL